MCYLALFLFEHQTFFRIPNVVCYLLEENVINYDYLITNSNACGDQDSYAPLSINTGSKLFSRTGRLERFIQMLRISCQGRANASLLLIHNRADQIPAILPFMISL